MILESPHGRSSLADLPHTRSLEGLSLYTKFTVVNRKAAVTDESIVTWEIAQETSRRTTMTGKHL